MIWLKLLLIGNYKDLSLAHATLKSLSSLLVKQILISSKTNVMYELPHKLSNNLKLLKLRRIRKVLK